jgi:hypothetical protein
MLALNARDQFKVIALISETLRLRRVPAIEAAA